MRVLISEYLCGGALAGSDAPASLRREGLLMLTAIAQDLALVPGWTTVATLDAGITASLPGEVIRIRTAAEERELFPSLLNEVDAALVIAPETEGILADRCRFVQAAGVASWNCQGDAIALCTDKLQLAAYLEQHDLPTIPTAVADLTHAPQIWPCVLKPRDGAGSQRTFLVHDLPGWRRAVESFSVDDAQSLAIVQPFVTGRSLSVAVNLSLDGTRMQCLDVVEQRLSADGRFCYRGGRLPAAIPPEQRHQIQELALAACRAIPGLAGYVGLDFIWSIAQEPVIVEINPRLTTSYVGYQHAFPGAIPRQWITTQGPAVEFQSASVPWEWTVHSIADHDASQSF